MPNDTTNPVPGLDQLAPAPATIPAPPPAPAPDLTEHEKLCAELRALVETMRTNAANQASPAPVVDEKPFIKVDAAAELLDVNRETLYKFIAEECPAWAKHIGGALRVYKPGLLKWFEEETKPTRRKRRVA